MELGTPRGSASLPSQRASPLWWRPSTREMGWLRRSEPVGRELRCPDAVPRSEGGARLGNQGFGARDCRGFAFVQGGGDRREELPRRVDLSSGGLLKHALNRRFDGALGFHVEASTRLGESEEGATSVAGIGATANQRLLLEPLQDAGERARVDVEEPGKMSGRDAGEPAHDAEDEALGSGHAETRLHSLGGPLHGMIDAPNDTHEIEDLAETGEAIWIDAAGGRSGHRTARLEV